MVLDSEMIVTIIAWLVSLFIAIMAWLQALSVQRKTQDHDMRVTKLQNELNSSRERLKSELAKELAAEESVLRVHDELRVRMFEMGAKAVDEAGANLQNMIYVYKNYKYAEAAEDVAPRKRLAEVTEVLIGTGMFLPPDLAEAFKSARSYLLGNMKQKMHKAYAMDDKNPAKNVIFQEAFAEADQRALKFRTAALEWNRAEWERLTRADTT